MNYKYTDDDYCDLFLKKICDNCGKCLEESGVDIRAINIDDIAKTVEENNFIEEELKKALELINDKDEYIEDKDDDYLNINIDSEHVEDYIDAFDNIVYLDEIGVEEEFELENLTEEIYPGIRKMKNTIK